jgi:hypothetical protein
MLSPTLAAPSSTIPSTETVSPVVGLRLSKVYGFGHHSSDLARQYLGGVIDHGADAPDAAGCLELAGVGLPHYW